MFLGIIFMIYFLDVIVLFTYAVNLVYLVFLSHKHFNKSSLKSRKLHEYPMVTIQLPIYNEQYVAERIIKGTIAIDYPKEKLEIQVLDDSTDETLSITTKLTDYYKRLGYNIKLFHRKIRTGQKGGALREALVKAEGEFLAIFDSDFIPAKNILTGTLPYFIDDPQTGMIQTRWGHINADYSLLTRAQAIAIDTHFTIDQVARFGEGLFFNFNGTAGVWRKKCILDAGNWQDDTLTEDMDLSYRAILKGWRLRYIKDIVNPSELPVQVSAYKSQQFRWAKGSIQTTLKMAPKVFLAKVPFKVKFQAFMHLTYYTVHPLLVLNILFILPSLIFLNSFLEKYPYLTSCLIMTMGLMLISPLMCLYSQCKLYSNWMKKVLWIPAIMIAGTGIAINNSKAFLEAIFRKPSEFIRTPKLGINSKQQKWAGKKYKIPLSFLTIVEFLFILYIIGTMAYSFVSEKMFIIPFLAFYLIAFGYIFMLGLIQSMQTKGQI